MKWLNSTKEKRKEFPNISKQSKNILGRFERFQWLLGKGQGRWLLRPENSHHSASFSPHVVSDQLQHEGQHNIQF
jgi:hypothetical protein